MEINAERTFTYDDYAKLPEGAPDIAVEAAFWAGLE